MKLKVINPYSQEPVCELPYDSAATFETKLSAAAAAQAAWKRLPVAQRCREVAKALEHFRRNRDSIARDITLQMGKPIVQARREVDRMLERAEHMVEIAPQSLAPEVLAEKPGFHRRIEHAPLGVVVNIAAWNYPLLIPVNVVVPALLAGNTVLLKHSARTPLCGLHFERAFESLSVPKLVQSVIATHEDASRLIADPRVAHVSFTGSVDGGQEVYRQASRRLIDVGLELGGKDPAYVAEDADLDFTVENVVDGACYNAGQSCCAVERVYVHQKLYREFLERAKTELERYVLDDPFAEATTMGPLASRPALDVLDGQVRDAVSRGAKLLLGGKRREGSKANFFLPTLLADVPNAAHAMQEESFGPLVPVLAVGSDDEALRHMTDTRYGLTASVWTKDPERAERLARELDVGTVFQNRCDFLDPALPWTGVRDSGMGSTLSRWGFFHLTRRKSIHFRRL